MEKSFANILLDKYFDELGKIGYKPSDISKITGVDRTTIFRLKKHERFPTKNMWNKLLKPFEYKLNFKLKEKDIVKKKK